MARLTPASRRAAIVDSALAVATRKGLGATTVRDVAADMGTSSGLVHHYFDSMDEVLAAAFEQAASADLALTSAAVEDVVDVDPVEALRRFLGTYTPVDKDWAFQLWLDAWAEAARRPAVQATSRRLNVAWQALLERTIAVGASRGVMTCADPRGAAWRILSLLDGLALQVVAHGTLLARDDVDRWVAIAAEGELGLAPGSLAPATAAAPSPAVRSSGTAAPQPPPPPRPTR